MAQFNNDAEVGSSIINDGQPCFYNVENISPVKAKPYYDIVKRVFDFTVAFLALIILAIPMALLMVIICLDSPGSPIFRQVRLGKNGKPFVLYKFRSMQKDAEENGPQLASENDPRVTKVGRFIRDTRIDELPQLINILRGEMSFVGPRPERPEFYDLYDTYINGFRQRMLVIPGMTGWAQVNGGYEIEPEKKIIFDVYYIKNRSVKMDLICLIKTVSVVFTHKGAR